MSKKIKQFNRAIVRDVTDEIQVALSNLKTKYGIDIQYVGGTFSPSNATIKLELQTKGTNGQVNSREGEEFKRHMAIFGKQYGLKPSDLGREFKVRGESYKLTGMSPRASRFPLLATRVRDDQRFKFAYASVKFPKK